MQRFNIFAVARLAWFPLLAIASPASADDAAQRVWKTQTDRSIREARELFQTAVKPTDDWSECSVQEKWSTYPIGAAEAQKYLGLKLWANVLSPQESTKLAEIINSKDRRFVCDEAEREKTAEKQRAQPVDRRIKETTYEYGFPVFNTSFTRAILMTHFLSLGSLPGRRIPPAGNGGAAIYAKRSGTWKFVEFINYYHFH